MHEILQEYADSRGLEVRIDRQACVLRGVKLLGLESKNGRTYLPAPLYEGAKVHVNHAKGAAGRAYQDRIGLIRGVEARAEGLFGDLHYNPKHALAEQLLWDAEHAPENVGLSHHVEAEVVRAGDRATVEAIRRVESVDLVADPATTRGLFESSEAGELERLRGEVRRLEAALAEAARPVSREQRAPHAPFDVKQFVESIRR